MSPPPGAVDRLVVEAATPDGIAFARLRGRSQVSVSFVPGYYAHSTEARLEDKLAQLGQQLWAARTTAYYEHRSRLLGRPVHEEAEPRTLQQRLRRAARDSLVSTGSSADGVVSLTAVGLLRWQAEVRPGTVREVHEAAFCAACGEAVERLLLDHLDQLSVAWAKRY